MDIFLGALVAVMAAALANRWHMCRYWQREHNSERDRADMLESLLATQNSTAHNFVDAARIIDINRSGRVNFFTVNRGDKIFIIETMGLLGDDVNAWRRDCGLQNDE